MRQHGRQMSLSRLVGNVLMNNDGLHIVTRVHVHHPKIAKEQQTEIILQICYNLLNPRNHPHQDLADTENINSKQTTLDMHVVA